MALRFVLPALGFVCAAAAAAGAQELSTTGSLEGTVTFYPQKAPNDATQAVGFGLVRLDPALKFPGWRIDSSIDIRGDSHDMTTVAATFWDRTSKRPLLSVRRVSASFVRGPVTFEAGKQVVRWGKTDILVPTDRFAPRDYLIVSDTEVLAVTAVRLIVANSSNSLDVVFTPRFTPSRTPLLDQRWTVPPAATQGLPLEDAGADYPKTPQIGVRWNHIGRHVEHSFSVFRGVNHLPDFTNQVVPSPLHIDVRRRYPQLASVGADAAVPLSWFTIKGEAAWLGSSTDGTEEYVLYVLQIERQAGEWLFIGGYAGSHTTQEGTVPRFAPDRGLARALVGRASYTIDTNRSLVFEAIARQDGDGFSGKVEYSQAFGPHLRLTGGGRLIKGEDTDFIGQYHHNSSVTLTLRYSF
jgi:hypothetical protein